MMKSTGFIVVKIDKSGAEIPQDLDSASGGYPYNVTRIQDARFFRDEEDAQKYCDIMNGGSYGLFEPREVVFTWEKRKM